MFLPYAEWKYWWQSDIFSVSENMDKAEIGQMKLWSLIRFRDSDDLFSLWQYLGCDHRNVDVDDDEEEHPERRLKAKLPTNHTFYCGL